MMQGDTQTKLYLQKILGYALTGDTSLETCFILYGATTRNGKSTLVETISYLMGHTAGYSLNMLPQTLAQKQNKDSRQANGDIARLCSCRFLNVSEPPKRMIFDVGLLKTLLGRDTITARHLHEREFEFEPYFKLFINTNFLPLIGDDTLFSSGRINVIYFNRHFEPHEQDKTLKDKLRTPDNISGILNWCIECMVRTCKNSKALDVYLAYKDWCDSNGFGCENKSNFFDELKGKNLLSKTGTVNGQSIKNIVRGYELIEDKANKNDTPIYLNNYKN